MKTLMLLFVALLAATTPSTGAYSKFRVVNIERIEEAPLDLTGDATIDDAPVKSHFNVSFTCNPGSKYVLYAAESVGTDAMWFPIKTVTAGEQFTTLTKVNEEDIVNVVVPMPFLNWTATGKGFVKVSETMAEQSPNEEDFAPITSIINYGDFLRVSFISQPYSQYYIMGAAVPAAPDSSRWCHVDTYWNGQVVQSTSVYSSGNETTTVDLANPLLPWILKDRGFLLIYKKPTPQVMQGGGFTTNMATPQFWSLVCTRNGGDDPSVRFKDLGAGGVSGQIAVSLNSTGPKQAEYGKYMTVKTSGKATLKGPLVPDTEINMPRVQDPPKPAKQFVRLSFYEFTDSSKVPEVKYEPNPDPHNGSENNFEFQVMIQSGSAIGVAAYKPQQSLGDKLKLEPLGVGFELNIPDNEGQCNVQQNWQFSPMDVPTLAAFIAAMAEDKKK